MTDETAANWYSNDAATFGDRIAAAREAQAMSQKDLAKRIGVSLKSLEAWENDLSEPRANRLQFLSGILNVSIPWLLTGEGHGVGAPDDAGDATDLADLMTEIRTLRAEMTRAADRMGVLEKRLKSAIGARAA